MSCNNITLWVPWNSTYNDVADPLGWTMFVGMLTLAFTLAHFTYAWSSMKHLFFNTLADPIVDWSRNLGVQTAFTLVFTAFYLCAFIYYWTQVVCNGTPSPRDPQDTFSLAMATMGGAYVWSTQIARLMRNAHFTNYGSNRPYGIYFMSQVVPKAIFVAWVIFPSAYAYKEGANALFPINTPVFGPVIIFVFITGVLLGLAPTFGWMAFWTDDARLAKTGSKDEKNGLLDTDKHSRLPTDNLHPLTSVYLLSDARGLNEYQKPQLRRLVGEIEYLPLPTAWIICYLIYMFSYGTVIYNDPIKPVVYTFVCGIVPFALMLYSHHNGVFAPYHFVMTFFFMNICYILEWVAPNPDDDDTDQNAVWVKARNWNLMTTGPYTQDVAGAGSTIKFATYFSFTLAVIVLGSMWMTAAEHYRMWGSKIDV